MWQFLSLIRNEGRKKILQTGLVCWSNFNGERKQEDKYGRKLQEAQEPGEREGDNLDGGVGGNPPSREVGVQRHNGAANPMWPGITYTMVILEVCVGKRCPRRGHPSNNVPRCFIRAFKKISRRLQGRFWFFLLKQNLWNRKKNIFGKEFSEEIATPMGPYIVHDQRIYMYLSNIYMNLLQFYLCNVREPCPNPALCPILFYLLHFIHV